MKALKTITNLVCWVAMISGYLAAVDAVQLAHTMLQLDCFYWSKIQNLKANHN